MNRPSLYHQNNELQRNEVRRILQKYLKLIRWNGEGTDSILDVGCGSGDITAELLLPSLPKNFKSLIGIDLSPEMVKFATRHYANSKLNYKCLDIVTKEIPIGFANNFDHIFSFFCLHWVQDQRKALQNMYTFLKTNGDMLISFVANSRLYKVYAKHFQCPKWSQYMVNSENFIPFYQDCENPAEEYEKLLTDVGFTTNMCKVVEVKHVHKDLDSFRFFVSSTNPFIVNIPEHMQDDYLDDFVNEYRNCNCVEYDESGEEIVANIYALFIISARKS